MVDYVYSVAIQVNSFQNNMADKTVWRINRGRFNEYSLYYVYTACAYDKEIFQWHYLQYVQQ